MAGARSTPRRSMCAPPMHAIIAPRPVTPSRGGMQPGLLLPAASRVASSRPSAARSTPPAASVRPRVRPAAAAPPRRAPRDPSRAAFTSASNALSSARAWKRASFAAHRVNCSRRNASSCLSARSLIRRAAASSIARAVSLSGRAVSTNRLSGTRLVYFIARARGPSPCASDTSASTRTGPAGRQPLKRSSIGS